MLDAQRLAAVLAANKGSRPGEQRRQAELDLEQLVQELLDAKVRHSLSSTGALDALVQVALTPGSQLSRTGALLLDRFRYRLAHVAMRNQQWEQASALLDAVLEGEGNLTRARLYRTVCTLRSKGRIDDGALQQLVQHWRQEGVPQTDAPPLDLLVQEPTTCLLELLLLCQGGEPRLLDQLYDDQGRQRTTGLKLFIKTPEDQHSRTVVLSEWLAQAHLEEWAQEGWLVVDTTVSVPGEVGRGSRLRVPGGNLRAPLVQGLVQVLAHHNPNGFPKHRVLELFREADDERLLANTEGPEWERDRATSAELADRPGRKVIGRRAHGEGGAEWFLQPPYAVVVKDEATLLRQAAGSFQ